MPGAEDLQRLKHDIKNQLSNIQLALEGIRYEIEEPGPDLSLYMDSIYHSAQKVDKLLDMIPQE